MKCDKAIAILEDMMEVLESPEHTSDVFEAITEFKEMQEFIKGLGTVSERELNDVK
jgi:hypothetical protein